jgi:hypothetical protein
MHNAAAAGLLEDFNFAADIDRQASRFDADVSAHAGAHDARRLLLAPGQQHQCS